MDDTEEARTTRKRRRTFHQEYLHHHDTVTSQGSEGGANVHSQLATPGNSSREILPEALNLSIEKNRKSQQPSAEKSEKTKPGNSKEQSPKRHGGGAGPRIQFPLKLHEMLEDAEKEHSEHIVAWQKDGRSFSVFKSQEFVKEIMPRYFRQTRFRSFQRQVRTKAHIYY